MRVAMARQEEAESWLKKHLATYEEAQRRLPILLAELEQQKNELAQVSGFGNLQAIGGAIDPRKILKIMIEYLDRKGLPILVGGLELRGLVE